MRISSHLEASLWALKSNINFLSFKTFILKLIRTIIFREDCHRRSSETIRDCQIRRFYWAVKLQYFILSETIERPAAPPATIGIQKKCQISHVVDRPGEVNVRLWNVIADSLVPVDAVVSVGVKMVHLDELKLQKHSFRTVWKYFYVLNMHLNFEISSQKSEKNKTTPPIIMELRVRINGRNAHI